MNWQEDFQELGRRKRTEFKEAEERKRQRAKDMATLIRRFGPIPKGVVQALGGWIVKEKGLDGGEVYENSKWRLYIHGINGFVEITFHLPDSIFMKCELPYGKSHIEDVELWRTTDENTLKDRIRNALAQCVKALPPY